MIRRRRTAKKLDLNHPHLHVKNFNRADEVQVREKRRELAQDLQQVTVFVRPQDWLCLSGKRYRDLS
jgi:hypothetical protein